MGIPPADGALEQALIDLGAHIAYPPEPQLVGAVARHLTRGRRSRLRRTAVALALVTIAAAVLAVVPGARTAVAGLVRLPGIRIIFGPSVPTPSPRPHPTKAAPTAVGVETPTTLESARAAVPFHVLVLAGAGLPPPSVSLSNISHGQAVLLFYPSGPGVPAAPGSAAGLVVTEFQGSLERAYLDKIIGSGTSVTDVTVNGRPGFWIEGAPHELVYVRPDGQVDFVTSRLAGNTLAWEQGGVTIRIEGAASRADAIAFAALLR